MGVSTNAILCYGFEVPEYDDGSGDEVGSVPWNGPDWDGDIDDWWIYGVNQASRDCYEYSFEAKNDFPKLPIDLVYHCSDSCTMYIVAAKGSATKAYRGHPEEIKPEEIRAKQDAYQQDLIAFCNQYKIKCSPSDMKWLLCSYWG